MPGYESARHPQRADTGVLPLGRDVQHYVGTAEHLIVKPGADKTHLVLIAEIGTWRVGLGDRTVATGEDNDVTTWVETVTVAVADGSGALRLAEGETVVLPAAANYTVIGFAAASVLTYFWV